MEDYLCLERNWQDDYFFALKVTAKSESVAAVTSVYSVDECIDSLSRGLDAFLAGDIDSYLWENGKKGDGSTTFVSLEFLRKDTLGHIQVEVYMELNDGGCFSKHNCCFYVQTELGLLERFNKSLPRLKEPQLGKKVILNDF